MGSFPVRDNAANMRHMFALETVKIPAGREKSNLESRSVYVAVDVWNRLGEIARELDRSRSSLVAGILKDWVEWYEAKKQGKAAKHEHD